MFKSARCYQSICMSVILAITIPSFFVGCTDNQATVENESKSEKNSVGSIDHSAETMQSSSISPTTPIAEAADLEGQPFTENIANGKFTDMDPTETGIDLVHVWNPPPRHASLIVGTFGCGVAIGDYDNDGWQDVYIARQSDAGRLYRNLQGLKFEDVTQKVGIDPSGMWAVGTTFADINNDGLLDLYICGYECPNRLYINNGGKFTEQAAACGLDFNGSSIVMNFADYDLDGDLDGYLVTNHQKPKTTINKPQVIRKRGQPPRVAPEFRERIFLVKHPDGGFQKSRAGQFDHFYRNDGGKFVEVTEESGIGLQPYIGLSASWWDYNRDGRPDLYVANDFKGPDFLYRNNGPDSNGKVTFSDVSKTALPHTPWYSMGSDFADINNDGLMDYLASDMAGTNHYRDKLSMGGMSGPDSNAWFLNAVDPPQYMRNALYLNTGTDQFGEIAYLSGLAKSDWTWTVKFADFDNDGFRDVFFTNGMTRDLFNSDLKNELADMVAAAKESEDSNVNPAQFAAKFWAAQEPFRLKNMAFKNSGDLKFKDVGSKWGLDHLGVSMGSAVGDLDNDGDLDIVVQGFEEPVKVFRNDLESENSIRFKLIGNTCNRNAYGARVDVTLADNPQILTRYISPTRGFMSTSESVAHFGIGTADSIESATIHWPGGSVQKLENLQAGRLYKIVQASEAVAQTPKQDQPAFKSVDNAITKLSHSELQYDDFERQPLLPNKHSQMGPGLAWGDIDGDGDDDLFMGGASYSTGILVENLGKGEFARKKLKCFTADSKAEDMGALFFDADADGDQDLYVVSGGVECGPDDPILQDRLYLNDGAGNFEKSTEHLPEMITSGAAVAAADFDKDGDLDLVLPGRIVPGSYPESPRSYLLRNNDGKFEDVTNEIAKGLSDVGMVTSAIWSDVDGDDWCDLLLTLDWGPVRLFKNVDGEFQDHTQQAGLDGQLGWFNSLCAGDIDNDGDTDFVVGNVGLNTKYKASDEKPELLYYGDFEGLGRKRIVEAKFENETCFPRRGLSCSSHAMPMVKEKLPTYHEFAISSLDMIYTEEKLDDATRFEANSLASGIWINQSIDSTLNFEFKPLPAVAQASPIFGSKLCDFNGDGNLDLYVVQNFYGPQRETGYMDGGVSQLFLGNGTGDFEAVRADQSGLVVTGDATSLTIADINEDSRPDFLVGKNNDKPQLFINQYSQNDVVAIKLQDLGKNNDVIGAKIVATYSDSTKQLHEVRSSESYLSQSAAVLFLGRGSQKLGRVLEQIEVKLVNGSQSVLRLNPDGSTTQAGAKP